MTSQGEGPTSAGKPEPFEPQGHLGRVPYDLRRPSLTKVKARVWNPDDPRLFPPHSIGIGWTINFYWLAHLSRYSKGRGDQHSA